MLWTIKIKPGWKRFFFLPNSSLSAPVAEQSYLAVDHLFFVAACAIDGAIYFYFLLYVFNPNLLLLYEFQIRTPPKLF